jgi:methylmalonyl-CoA mutase N-terminal domain/subunit
MSIGDTVEKEQVSHLRQRKQQRDGGAARRCLDAVKRGAEGKQNLLPAFLDAARARCTVGEIMNALADVFGRYDGAARW